MRWCLLMFLCGCSVEVKLTASVGRPKPAPVLSPLPSPFGAAPAVPEPELLLPEAKP